MYCFLKNQQASILVIQITSGILNFGINENMIPKSKIFKLQQIQTFSLIYIQVTVNA